MIVRNSNSALVNKYVQYTIYIKVKKQINFKENHTVIFNMLSDSFPKI